jgi:hypothetical protein
MFECRCLITLLLPKIDLLNKLCRNLVCVAPLSVYLFFHTAPNDCLVCTICEYYSWYFRSSYYPFAHLCIPFRFGGHYCTTLRLVHMLIIQWMLLPLRVEITQLVGLVLWWMLLGMLVLTLITTKCWLKAFLMLLLLWIYLSLECEICDSNCVLHWEPIFLPLHPLTRIFILLHPLLIFSIRLKIIGSLSFLPLVSARKTVQ